MMSVRRILVMLVATSLAYAMRSRNDATHACPFTDSWQQSERQLPEERITSRNISDNALQ